MEGAGEGEKGRKQEEEEEDLLWKGQVIIFDAEGVRLPCVLKPAEPSGSRELVSVTCWSILVSCTGNRRH